MHVIARVLCRIHVSLVSCIKMCSSSNMTLGEIVLVSFCIIMIGIGIVL